MKRQAVWTCSNSACPTGTEKHLCGYCRESSFNPVTGVCANPACRTHKIVRNICPTCQYHSVLTLGGMKFCLNRLCETHAGWITACPTCANDSLIQLDGTAVCVKSTCANLLYLVPWPASLGSRRGLGTTPPPPGAAPRAAAPGTTALSRYQADPDAETVVPGAPKPPQDAKSLEQDPKSRMILPAKPGRVVDPDASTVILPEGFDEDAETVLESSRQVPQGRAWTAADNDAETALTNLAPPPASKRSGDADPSPKT